MKNIRTYLKVAGICFGVLLMAACPTAFNAPSGGSSGTPDGKGVISLNLFSSDARTVRPAGIESELQYKAVFSTAAPGIADVTAYFDAAGEVSQELDFAAWDITVYAFYDDSGTDVNAGIAELAPVTLSMENVEVTINAINTLIRPIAEGSGFLSWELIYPAGVDTAMLYITKSDTANTLVHEIDLDDIDPDFIGADSKVAIPLPAGSYRFRVALSATEGSETRVAGDFEIVHIYRGFTSIVVMDFADEMFFGYEPVTVSVIADSLKGTVLLSLKADADFASGPMTIDDPNCDVYIKVEPEAGFEIDGLPVVTDDDGDPITVTEITGGELFKFTMVYSDVTVAVDFMIARKELSAGAPVSALAAATTANVTFTGATGLVTGDLAAADFTVTTGAAITNVAVAGGTATVTVTFSALAGDPTYTKTYTVGIAGGSDVIKGDATVTITQLGDRARAFGPIDFEDITVGAFTGGGYWVTVDGAIGTDDTVNTTSVDQEVLANSLTTGNTSTKVLRVNVNNQGGTRGKQLNFINGTDTITSGSGSRYGVEFDWRPSTANNRPAGGNGFLSIQDGTSKNIGTFANSVLDNQFITFIVNTGDGLRYKVGNHPASYDVSHDDFLTGAVNTGIAAAGFNTWYRFNVTIDMTAETIDVLITNIATESEVYSEDGIPFDPSVTYNKKISSIRVASARVSSNVTWETFIDNIALFRDEKAAVLTPPSNVTGLDFAVVSDGIVDLTWSSANRATSYRVEYGVGTAFNLTETVTAAAVQLTGLNSASTYQARVVAINSAGESAAPSNTVTFTPQAPQGAPDAVASLQCVDAVNGEAVFMWPAAARADGYKFYHAAGSGEYSTFATVTGTSYTVTGLANGTAYKAKVVAFNAVDDASASNAVTFTPVLLDYVRAFPKIHFEGNNIGDNTFTTYWTTQAGIITANTGAMTQGVTENPSSTNNSSTKALNLLMNNQNGSRALMFRFVNNTSNVVSTSNRHGIAFDWYPGIPNGNSQNGVIAIQDSATATINNAANSSSLPNQFVSFYATTSTIKFRVGNVPDASNGDKQDLASADALALLVDTGISDLQKWHRIQVVIDTANKTIAFTITDPSTGSVLYSKTDVNAIPFPVGFTPNNDIGTMRFLGGRTANGATWSTYIDNIEVFRYISDPFVPVTGITMTSADTVDLADSNELTLAATVAPSNATNKTITWSIDALNNTAGAVLSLGNKLTFAATGSTDVVATITNGATASSDYTETFTITVNNTPPSSGTINININISAGQGLVEVDGWADNPHLDQTVDSPFTITIDNFSEFTDVEWYLNGILVTSGDLNHVLVGSGESIELDLSVLRPVKNYLTVVVTKNGYEYSKKLDFTVMD